jgi:hypothetical protein
MAYGGLLGAFLGGDDIALKDTAWDGDDLLGHDFGVMAMVSPCIQLADSGGRRS